MNVSLRAAKMADLDSVVEFMSEYYAYDRIPFHRKTATRAAGELIADERLGLIWLICNDGKPIGYLVFVTIYGLEFGGRTAWVDEFYIREPHRGKGIAREAMTFVIDECRKRNIVALRLEVEHGNTRARDVYEKLGFVRHTRDLMTRHIDS